MTSRASFRRRLWNRRIRPRQALVGLLLAVLVLTASLGQRFYNQPELSVATQSPQTFTAPETVTLVDQQTTEQNQVAARSGAISVLMVEPNTTGAIKRDLGTLLKQAGEIRKQAGSLPYLETSVLSRSDQSYLRQLSAADWQEIWSLASEASVDISLLTEEEAAPAGIPIDRLDQLTPPQKSALEALLAYRQATSDRSLRDVGNQIEVSQRRYRNALDLIELLPEQRRSLFSDRLLELSDADWKRLVSKTQLVLEQMLTQGIHPGMPPELLRRAAETHISASLPPPVQALATDLLTAVLRPNLVEDPEKTRLRAELAAKQVNPVTVSINAGDVIVDMGETIRQSDFVLLDHFNLTRRRFNWLGFTSFGLLVACATAIYLGVEQWLTSRLRQRDLVLVLVLILGVAGLVALDLPTLGLPAVGLLVGSFYGSTLGAVLVLLLTAVLPIGAEVSGIPLISGAVAALVGAWIAPQLRSREEFALLGGFVGLAQGSVHLILTLMFTSVSTSAWQSILANSALQGLFGVAWSIVALGVSPYLEHVFDIVTPIRLAELSNPNRPLLKRLASEAPGTFQHTLFVTGLAEAAAQALNLNVELVRAGTLYHDIGKMHDPLGFIENQMGGPNKHDQLDDPWASAAIIKKHVTLGLVMARKHRLPKAIRAFIPEHQGSMPISYFLQQAEQKQKENPELTISRADFCYDGPIPQTPETGVVMLADSCEAALRSLSTDASFEEAFTMVNRILHARWKSKQLADSGLLPEDLKRIADVFVQVWQQYNHKRIAYPQSALTPAS
ncbi:HDIG domain-containing protein [Romeria aff. gracilis LEGE 07310]|uniref:HDIG domain-containing protein n=1 Tax=Vasconcelosia minhoensis LEGE 07310 TaxID=915328 RepID=A0A8J7B090_9CYAN|nr:HDIG domain-containing metalloprotein [Romeria gracilis]MBE9079767.1 HDIG domain-containing protein [Romeria aff. gracilis LEGE 07310]